MTGRTVGDVAALVGVFGCKPLVRGEAAVIDTRAVIALRDGGERAIGLGVGAEFAASATSSCGGWYRSRRCRRRQPRGDAGEIQPV